MKTKALIAAIVVALMCMTAVFAACSVGEGRSDFYDPQSLFDLSAKVATSGGDASGRDVVKAELVSLGVDEQVVADLSDEVIDRLAQSDALFVDMIEYDGGPKLYCVMSTDGEIVEEKYTRWTVQIWAHWSEMPGYRLTDTVLYSVANDAVYGKAKYEFGEAAFRHAEGVDTFRMQGNEEDAVLFDNGYVPVGMYVDLPSNDGGKKYESATIVFGGYVYTEEILRLYYAYGHKAVGGEASARIGDGGKIEFGAATYAYIDQTEVMPIDFID